MLQSKLFYKTNKNKSADAQSVSHDLLIRAGYIDQLMSGVYSYLPLGYRVLKNIENIIRRNMELVDGQELLLPVLQPKENWVKTDRINIEKEILFLMKGNGDKEYVLGPTHEEVVTPLAKKMIFSYRDLPLYVFQIQDKLRDELRPKSGLLRVKEFIMKDLYSFHATQKDLEEYYERVAKAYVNIYKECGIGKTTYRTFASGGSFSKYSDEFQTITNAGEDLIYICTKCSLAFNKEIKAEVPKCTKCGNDQFEEKKAVEVGNIFKMGTRYSAPFDLKFTDRDAVDKPVLMGCYGIGLGRLMAAIVESFNDDKGIIWPKSVAPFLVHLIGIENNPKVKKAAQKLYTDCTKNGIQVLYDDRENKTAGEKFGESDLLGIPYRIVISERTLAENSVEIKERSKEKGKLVKLNQISNIVKNVK
jgi:prolyl-tRNA synthetase